MIKKYLEIFFVFFKIGIVTFGGGLAMLPILERELVTKKKWIQSEELLDYFAIGQSTPGIIAVNVATFCGNKLYSVIGAIIATLGIVTPSVIIISILSSMINTINTITWVKKALTGINVAVACNLTYACFNFIKKSVKDIVGIIIFLITFVLIYVLNINAFFVILTSIIFGIIKFYYEQNKLKKSL